MRVIVVGLGVQGRKRLAVAGDEAVGTVDPDNPAARYKRIEDVPLAAYDAALLCVPDEPKIEIVKQRAMIEQVGAFHTEAVTGKLASRCRADFFSQCQVACAGTRDRARMG